MVRSVYHIMSTMFQCPEPRPHDPNLTAKEVGKHSLPVCLVQGMGLESKEPASASPLGRRHWRLAAPPRSDGWHVVAHFPDWLDAVMSNAREALALWHERRGRSWPWICNYWMLCFQIGLGICWYPRQPFPTHPHCHPNMPFPSSGKWNTEYLCLLPPQIQRRPMKLYPDKRILLQEYDFCLE